MKKLLLIAFLALCPALAVCQVSSATGFCDAGASQAVTSGQRSTNYLQGSIPYCTVTVYNTGTVNLATIYSNGSSSRLSNPFKASQIGQWLFYASTSNCYDIYLSGGNPPNTYVTPVTMTNICLGGGSGSAFTLNTLSGAVTLAVGSGLSITPSGNTLTISLVTPVTITGFTGCSGSEELGQTVSSPTCAVAYTGSPTGAVITNTDSVDSPLTLSSPYTSGTISGTFSHSAITTTTVTVTAQPGSVTATQNYTWNPRIFDGTGTSGGATGATASGTSAVLVGDTGTLASAGLGAETIGTTFVFNLTGNYFYMLLIGSGHTFTVNGFPASLSSTPISFVNEYGVTVSMNLYVGPTFGTGTYTVVVTG